MGFVVSTIALSRPAFVLAESIAGHVVPHMCYCTSVDD